MISIKAFSSSGVDAFIQYINGEDRSIVPSELARDENLTVEFVDRKIDPSKIFLTRFEFGEYLSTLLEGLPLEMLLRPDADPMWAWINALYFSQLVAGKIRRADNYVPERSGAAGSVLHRNASRTAFELVKTHGANAKFALQQGMAVRGQLLESLTASQEIVRNKEFFAAAANMYVDVTGKIKRGANSKPPPAHARKPGDDSGKGTIRRLPLALRRLNLTYDVDALTTKELLNVLPREFSRWTKVSIPKSKSAN